MFAVYAARPNPEHPLASLVVGDRPEAEVPDGWVRVKISHASAFFFPQQLPLDTARVDLQTEVLLHQFR